jgi:hypothetical protein
MLFDSCKEQNPFPIPNNRVDIPINLLSFDSDLSIGSVKTFITQLSGFGGVVVYRYGLDDFVAYEIGRAHV